ncbi:hypothetical protein EDB80DRAFT_890704 [Ilyonectria destructans]|nr:hypothetical protein EDB80DRAFT_890704 [Ilyonectria destructans]
MSSDISPSSASSPPSFNINLTDETRQQQGDDKQDAGTYSYREIGANNTIKHYVTERSEEFRRLQELRKKGWQSEKGDDHFRKQRWSADTASRKNAEYFYTMMQGIGKELHRATKAFDLSHTTNQRAILDMCMAPGGFTASVLKKYPEAHVRAMSLPVEQGGHEVLLKRDNLAVEFLDITMLAGDMGLTKDDIPISHPDREAFILEKKFSAEEKFDLAFCDGQVLRTHQRSEWRELHEARRLTNSQLALSLEHLNSGGTMVILLHKLEAWGTVKLLHTLSRFSTVKLFKHPKCHSMRSSFYVVARNIHSDGELALRAIAEWKEGWKIASLGTDEERNMAFQAGGKEAQEVLDEFGGRLVALGRTIWSRQAAGLENAKFMKA